MLIDLKQFAAHPWHPKTKEDYFMYSIHNMVKVEAQNQLVEEQLTNLMYRFDGIPYINNSPKYDEDIVEIDANYSKKSISHGWEEELQLYLKDENQQLHINHDSKEDSEESFQVNAKSLPLYFASFMRKHYKQIVNIRNGELSYQSDEEIMDDKEHVLDPDLHPLIHLEFQILDASSESVTCDELIHFDSIPLCSNSFQILKGNFDHILNDEYRKDYKVSLELMQ
jgi:hypothetical protein